jgi:hypothetical protein
VPCPVGIATRGARTRTGRYVEHPEARKHAWVQCIAGRSRNLVRYAGKFSIAQLRNCEPGTDAEVPSWTGTGWDSRPIDTMAVNRGGEHRGVDVSKKPLRASNVAFIQNHPRLGVIYPRGG